ncbi:hypothetical protein [Streptomyces mangrovisoli]|uniref:DUF1616 domain-containing protein n=1 Tax=Streptomyces mangrovisoli TaxID=1428628 RepID=A0A1J4NZM8_9ACTN|nr:hypothetical protein [Streptomyces mangrovisoli]OIJ67792.1 hypothetical protein WN71_011345 [Streptomyces mangrovisoli]
MSRPRWALALSGWVALAAVLLLPDASAPRVAVTTAFLLVCPGLAASRWARPTAVRASDRAALLETGVLAVVVSVSMTVLVVEPLFLGGVFTVAWALLVLAAATTALAVLPGPGERRLRPPRAVPGSAARPADAGRHKRPPASH